MAVSVFLKDGLTVSPDGMRKADVLITDGKISAIGTGLEVPADAEIIDVAGRVITAGFTDVHVHFREPGFTAKENIHTGSLAAARGGYTTVCAMPNLKPVPDSADTLAVEQEAIDRGAVIEVLPYCSITKGRQGSELVDMDALKGSCIAFSDDGSGVQEDGMMLEAMEAAAREDVLIAAHCEVNSLLRGGYIHDGEYCKAHGHKGICSESEWGEIKRDIELAERTGCRYHVCHISTAESVALIRDAKARGVKVTCETGPHYLTLCDDDLQEDGRFKMNPPLRSASDREALIEGLQDGTIDAIATDHAPHTAEEKSKGLAHSAMGIVGLETSFPVLYTHLVRTGRISLYRLLELMSASPRKVFRLPELFVPGAPADITVIDLDTKYSIDSSSFLSMGKSTPFVGWEVYGRILLTLKDGRIVYEDEIKMNK